MPACSAASRASLWARTLKPMTAAPDAPASVMSDSVMPPTPEWITRAWTSSLPTFSSAPTIASSEPCTSALTTSANSLRPAPSLRSRIMSASEPRAPDVRGGGRSRFCRGGEAGAGRAGGGALALLPGAVVGDLAGAGFRLDDGDTVAGFRRAVEAEHLDRNRRPGLLRHRALVVDERPDAAPLGAGDGDVAGAQRAALDEHGCDRPAAAIELRLDDGALGRAGAVRPEVEDLGLQLQALEQRVEA